MILATQCVLIAASFATSAAALQLARSATKRVRRINRILDNIEARQQAAEFAYLSGRPGSWFMNEGGITHLADEPCGLVGSDPGQWSYAKAPHTATKEKRP